MTAIVPWRSGAAGTFNLRSRNDNDFNVRYPVIAKALASMPDDTVIDGEIVALDGDGKPSFNMLQNYKFCGRPGRAAHSIDRSAGTFKSQHD